MAEHITTGQRYKVETQLASLTDESLVEAKKLSGLWMRRYGKALTVTKDNIRQYTNQLGDDNPLFCDEKYAKKTKWGGIIAPPTFLMLVDDTIVAPGLRGIQWVYCGIEWEWFLPARPGDRITAKVRMYDAVEHKGQHVARMIEQIG